MADFDAQRRSSGERRTQHKPRHGGMFRFACNGELDNMSQYDELDKRIVEAITNKSSPLYNNSVVEESERLATLTGRKGFRVIDARLQALRKKGEIRYVSKLSMNGAGGWVVVD